MLDIGLTGYNLGNTSIYRNPSKYSTPRIIEPRFFGTKKDIAYSKSGNFVNQKIGNPTQASGSRDQPI